MKIAETKTETIRLELDLVTAAKCGGDNDRPSGVLFFLEQGVNNLARTTSSFFEKGCKQPMEAVHG